MAKPFSSREHRKHKKGPGRSKKGQFLDKWNNKVAVFVAFNIVVVILSVVYFFYQHHLENIVITPLNLPNVVTKSGLDVPSRFWGTYRPGSYFGMQSRSPQTLATGLMWFSQSHHQRIDIRDWCGDHVNHYSWMEHDGESFGVQNIDDKEYNLVTSFVKQVGGDHGGDYTVRISVRPKAPDVRPLSLLFYAYATSPDAALTPTVVDGARLRSVRGHMEALGNFSLHFRETSQKGVLKYNFLATEAPPNIARLKETLMHHHALFQAKDRLQILGLVGDARKKKTNLVAYQVTFAPAPFDLEVYFESGSFSDRPAKVVGPLYDQELEKRMKGFGDKFEGIFGLRAKGYSTPDTQTARAALSNLLGGIGYFHGASLVQSAHNKEPVSYWNAALYTAVPSRSFFPRGFLWDEGFHNLLVLEWNPEITLDIVGHWLDLMNTEGWIPREQILGQEARERVPAEFVVQKNTNANPPTFFLTIQRLLDKVKQDPDGLPEARDFLRKSLPRLKVWFDWFNKSQTGMIPGTYRWRGRDSQTDAELNPKALSSGLDDYPRATHPTIDERHLDLRCWIALAAGVLADIGDFVGEPLEKHRATQLHLSDNALLDRLHWSTESESYSDYGFHSREVKLVKERLDPQTVVYRRVVKDPPALRFVDDAFGYVGLFPFLLKIVDADNPRLGKILMDLKNPRLLWTNYGLRSLAKSSPYYLKHNTEHDPPYWRGSIWINMNFLAVRALRHYSSVEGPYKSTAGLVYEELRANVVRNVLDEYRRTGFVWEQYDDKTGRGKGVHPFTGWSALFVLMMGEIF